MMMTLGELVAVVVAELLDRAFWGELQDDRSFGNMGICMYVCSDRVGCQISKCRGFFYLKAD